MIRAMIFGAVLAAAAVPTSGARADLSGLMPVFGAVIQHPDSFSQPANWRERAAWCQRNELRIGQPDGKPDAAWAQKNEAGYDWCIANWHVWNDDEGTTNAVTRSTPTQ